MAQRSESFLLLLRPATKQSRVKVSCETGVGVDGGGEEGTAEGYGNKIYLKKSTTTTKIHGLTRQVRA